MASRFHFFDNDMKELIGYDQRLRAAIIDTDNDLVDAHSSFPGCCYLCPEPVLIGNGSVDYFILSGSPKFVKSKVR